VIHKNGWYKGHLYGMVMGFDVFACYYRPDQFREAGLDPDRFPATLEDLTATARRLDRYDGAKHLTRLGFLPGGIFQYAPAFGGTFYDTQANKVVLNTPENRRALKYIVDSEKYYGFDTLTRFNAGLKSGAGATWPFIDGSECIVLAVESRIRQLAQYAPDLKYRVAPLPPPAGGKPLATYSLPDYVTIPVGAKHSEGAWEFLKFWSGLDNPQQAARFNVMFGFLPTSPQMAASPAYQAFLRKNPQYRTFVALAASKNSLSIPPVPYQTFLIDRIATADDLAESGAKTPEQALAGLEQEVRREQVRRKELGYDE
jgi:multiple sugar transport system substrate-binding protein